LLLRRAFAVELNALTVNTKNTKSTKNTKTEDHAEGWRDAGPAGV
jgi:hypothetical protein